MKTEKDDKLRIDALRYHESGRKGKIEVVPTKPHDTQRDLALAYSPGVAEPCLEIEKTPQDVYKYTAKGNLVAVISNGTAVLGLGDIGPLASKPVMEGKGLLFKIFADIDVFDIEINEKDPEKFIETVKAISPTFGGINLEDIKAPEAFEIERRLKEELDIPVMHDDQHGTAIISAAALLNALELADKKIEEVSFVVNGAGAAAIACTKLYVALGADPDKIFMCDSKGVINQRRTDLNEEKLPFVRNTNFDTLKEAMVGSDVFIGLSKADVVSPEMLLSMNENPIVFAMANPVPEINYDLAVETRSDVIMATGRSDYPNQVNNVLGFPFIFRGALDTQASKINEEMKLAAVHALADLAKEPVPEMVQMAYKSGNLSFGRDYIIPKPFDNRLITNVSMAVAKAAMESGVARKQINNWAVYEEELLNRMDSDQKLIRMLQNRAKQNPKTIVFSNAAEYNVLKAAQIVHDEGIAKPILLGNKEKVEEIKKEFDIELDVPIIDPKSKEAEEQVNRLAEMLWKKRQRKGMTLYNAKRFVTNRDYFGSMMVEAGEADAFLTGSTRSYASSLKPVLEVIGPAKGVSKVAGLMMILSKKGPLFFADTTINDNPTAKELVKIARMTEYVVRGIGIRPRTAMLSFENFSARTETSKKVSEAVSILHRLYPDMVVDGEIQPDFALDEELISKTFPFSKLNGKRANVLIFPNLAAGNLSYKILRGIENSQVIGPILMGLNKPVHILQMRSTIDEIVNLATIAVLDAQQRQK
ncbi:NADP-dependent malic enzyme [Moheibacter lacus]|uniref:NADP-dependent malic enzyme n=1 Tax=Moheibacter lacus TaxID=2745851 RepID=A0A838ZRK5_9FLAO|nr:NADP-dependent malic enzyme [Moheibacter lacus]MBA5629282.1 NADP-dependent malic enzyme [Moheibacter lacus]